jgi:hypothetical protein
MTNHEPTNLPELHLDDENIPGADHWIAHNFGSQMLDLELERAGFNDPTAVKTKFLNELSRLAGERREIRNLLDTCERGLYSPHEAEFKYDYSKLTEWRSKFPGSAGLLDAERAQQFMALLTIYSSGVAVAEEGA